ncbi:MAG: hypothetical protein HZB13_05880 [Acidobacteria bacterium]|nr:hypothetical protein [Acidobacteriota bacterium]
MQRLLVLLTFAAFSLFAQEHAQEHAAQAGQSHETAGENLTAKWVNFAILAAGLGFLAVKFGGPALKSQQKEILDGLSEAAQRAEAAAAQAAEIDRKVAGLQGEVDKVRAKAEAELAAESVRIEAETAQAIAKLAETARQEIASAAKFAAHDLKAQAAQLALQLAEQKIQARMDSAAQGRLVDSFVTRLGERQ